MGMMSGEIPIMKRIWIVLLLLFCVFSSISSSSALVKHSNDSVPNDFITRLFNNQVGKIKLIGDSITDGNGARNYSPPSSSNQVIFDDGKGNVFYEPNYHNHSWANKFREFISNDYPSVQFVNAAIGGKSAKWANENKQYWIDEDEDVVFVMLGTNDRWDSKNLSEFRINLKSFLSYVDDRSNTMIVMTANPTLNDGNDSYNFGIREVDKVISEVTKSSGYTHISLYREMLSYSERSGATLKTLIENGGSHPNNEGYDVMWKIIQENLGILDDSLNWNDSNPSALHTVLIGSQSPYVKSTTGIDFFDKGKKTVVELDSYSDVKNFPEQTTGWLTTTRGFTNDLYSHQIWEPRQSFNIYKRIWDTGSSKWSEWRKLNQSEHISKTTVTVNPGTINANSVKEIEVLVVGLSEKYTPIISIVGSVPKNVITSAHVDYSAKRVYLRVFNTSSNPVNIDTLDVVCVQMSI